MKYDFSSILTRQDALAVDKIPFDQAEIQPGFSKIPMWIADMAFNTAPVIQETVAKRLSHGTFGYFQLSDEYFDSIIRWQKIRNQVEGLTKEAISYENGVLGCVASAVQAFTLPGEAILLHSPTYIGFTMTLENNGRKIILSEMKRDADGVWRMDYEDMDRKIKENQIHFCIFCSPHNPTGRVWEREEIEKAMEVYRKNDCIVISDEIWSDLVLNGNKHIPTQSVSEDAKMRTIAIYAPTKTFNLAGFVGSYSVIYNPTLRDRERKAASLSHYNDANVLSMHALIGAYTDAGMEWTDELLSVLSENVNYAYDFICKNFEGVTLAKPQGTYMLYLNCHDFCEKHGITIEDLIRRGISVGVVWQDGHPFHQPDSIRINLALPAETMKEAFNRLKEYVFI